MDRVPRPTSKPRFRAGSRSARVLREARRTLRGGGPARGPPPLLNDGVRRGHQAGDLDLLPVDHGGHAGRDLVLPVVALVDGIVEALALRLALEAADPHVDAVVLLAHEAAQDDHAHLDLEGDDLLFHALDPLVALARPDVVLPKLEEHLASLGGRLARPPPRAHDSTALDGLTPPGRESLDRGNFEFVCAESLEAWWCRQASGLRADRRQRARRACVPGPVRTSPGTGGRRNTPCAPTPPNGIAPWRRRRAFRRPGPWPPPRRSRGGRMPAELRQCPDGA